MISKSKAVLTALEFLSTKLQLDRFHLYLNLRDMQRVYLVKPLTDSRGAGRRDIGQIIQG
ncbi:MAG TPA: hypothetical protein VGO37_07255 [Steroidobacteraceae bacterium]|nr:hypothetical protein [Steroidobacteraceae bacterium]